MESIKSIFNNMSDLSKLLIKMLLGILGALVIIIIIAMILRLVVGQKKGYSSIEETLQTAAEKYFEKNSDKLPSDNDVAVVTAEQLAQADYMKELSEYLSDGESCSATVTAINNDDNYAYIPNLDCGDDYQTSYLVNTILDNEIVSSGDGLYYENNEYIFRGEKVDNYVQFGDLTFRILKINSDNTLRLLLVVPIAEYKNNVWDDRYNIDLDSNAGINDFSISRMKDLLETIYNDEEVFTTNMKALMVKQTLCVGSRQEDSTDLTDAAECSSTIENQMLGLIQANEYVLPSIDSNCVSITSKSCLNYNYLTDVNYSFWTITAGVEDSSKIYRVSNSLYQVKAANSGTVLFTLHLNDKVQIDSGDGSQDNPYVINTYE